MPKLQYILRTSPCHSNSFLEQFDNILRSGLCSLLNTDMSDNQWLQASLPVNKGGIGIRSGVMLASSAFLASAASTLPLQEAILSASSSFIASDHQTAIALLDWHSRSTLSEPDPPFQHIQKAWDDRICDTVYQKILNNASNPTDRARMLAVASPHAGDWLNALPLTSVGLRLSNEATRTAVGYRLGALLCKPHNCVCGADLDARGLHALSCKRSGPRQTRHAQMNDIVWRAVKKTQVPAQKEPLGLSHGDSKRPDGCTLIPWSRGRPLAWDVTIPDTFAASHIAGTSVRAGSAAQTAADNKMDKYADIANTHVFVPVAVETGGAWCTASLDFVTDLGKRISNITSDPHETSHLFQRLSIALQQGNSIAFSNSLSGDSGD